MRFLFLTQYFPPEVGATQVRLAAMARELVRLGHQVEVVTAMPNYPVGKIFPAFQGKLYVRDNWEGVRVHRVWLYARMGAGLKRVFSYLSFTLTSLFGLLRTEKPDYVFVDSPPLFLSIPGVIVCCFWGVPLIFNVADLWPDSVLALGVMKDGVLIKFAKALERWSYQKAAYVNSVTEGMRLTLVHEKKVPPEKILFLPNGADSALFKPVPPDLLLKQTLGLAGKRVVLYAGGHGYTAALEQVLQGAKLLEDVKDLHFLFVGSGSEKGKLQGLAQEWNLKNATFLEPVPPEQVPALASLACCGLVTTKNSPLLKGARPAKTFAMMACGKAIVLAMKGELERLVREAGAGLVVPPECPEELAKAILNLANDPALAARLGANGRAYVERNFRWSALIADWLDQLTVVSKQAVPVLANSEPSSTVP